MQQACVEYKRGHRHLFAQNTGKVTATEAFATATTSYPHPGRTIDVNRAESQLITACRDSQPGDPNFTLQALTIHSRSAKVNEEPSIRPGLQANSSAVLPAQSTHELPSHLIVANRRPNGGG